MIELTCENCGGTFAVFPTRIRRGKPRFCSVKCKGEGSRGVPLKGTDEDRLWARVEKTAACWNWTGPTGRHGYGIIGIMQPRKTTTTHRLAYELTNGPIADGAFVLHSCDNRRCVNPSHLRLGTVQDNADDMKARNRQARGAKHPAAKLREDDIHAIRAAMNDGAMATVLAKQYGVSERTIREVRDRLIWKWLD